MYKYYCYDFIMGLNDYKLMVKEVEIDTIDENDNITMIIKEDNELKFISRLFCNIDCDVEKIEKMFNELYAYMISKEEIRIGLSKVFYRIIERSDCFKEIYKKLEERCGDMIKRYVNSR